MVVGLVLESSYDAGSISIIESPMIECCIGTWPTCRLLSRMPEMPLPRDRVVFKFTGWEAEHARKEVQRSKRLRNVRLVGCSDSSLALGACG